MVWTFLRGCVSIGRLLVLGTRFEALAFFSLFAYERCIGSKDLGVTIQLVCD
jgi:hypothetical protein